MQKLKDSSPELFKPQWKNFIHVKKVFEEKIHVKDTKISSKPIFPLSAYHKEDDEHN